MRTFLGVYNKDENASMGCSTRGKEKKLLFREWLKCIFIYSVGLLYAYYNVDVVGIMFHVLYRNTGWHTGI